jgi:hypothetical protein
LFIPPAGLLGLEGEAWLAAGSSSANWGGCDVWVSADGVSYQQIGTITTGARYGVLTAALASAADPDNTNTLKVDLTNSAGTLAGVTAAQMNAGGTLSLVDNELVGYQNATLTAANKYDLAPLRRGLYSTSPAAHSIGGRFVRLDDAIFKIKYRSLNVGNTLYVKLPSFNIYGRALEDISTVSAYTLSLTALPALPATALSSPSGTVTGTYTVQAADYLILADATGGAVTINLPAAASSKGRTLIIKKIDSTANAVTLDPSSAELIDGGATASFTASYTSLMIVCDGTSWQIV